MSYILEAPVPHRDNVHPNAADVEVVIHTSDQAMIGPITISYLDFLWLEYALTQDDGMWRARDLTPNFILPASRVAIVCIRASSIISFNYTINKGSDPHGS